MTDMAGAVVPQVSRSATQRPHLVLVNAWHEPNVWSYWAIQALVRPPLPAGLPQPICFA